MFSFLLFSTMVAAGVALVVVRRKRKAGAGTGD